MQMDILTLFPSMFVGPFAESILGRAVRKGILTINLWNIRDFSTDKHRITDDTPYGGGAGMVLKPDVVVSCIEQVRKKAKGPLVYLTPQGKRFGQRLAATYARLDNMILLCGHYEGLDERVRAGWVDEEVSIGDYVLTGGELAAMVVVDAVGRLVPGVLGAAESAERDSFVNGLLEHPHYTRPVKFRNQTVPDVLLSGHHERIRRWRLKESLRRTLHRRCDLLRSRVLTAEERRLLQEIYTEEFGRR